MEASLQIQLSVDFRRNVSIDLFQYYVQRSRNLHVREAIGYYTYPAGIGRWRFKVQGDMSCVSHQHTVHVGMNADLVCMI